MITCTRYHDISCGHRVVGGGKCANLHGHNYRIHFTCSAPALDRAGMVVDFSFIKVVLCIWLERNWDHKFLLWDGDPLRAELRDMPGLELVPFNPTAENMAAHLLELPWALPNKAKLVSVRVEETRKCSAEVTL